MTARLLRALIHSYQYILSPFLGTRCRFAPSCSHYALEAVETHGARRGVWLSMKRLMRCQPWGRSGFDPVPPK